MSAARHSLQRLRSIAAIVIAVAVTVVVVDTATYAATGSSLILGRLNKAGAPTTIQNTGSGPAIKLVTSSPASPPFTTGSKGKVINLFADRAAKADTATNATSAANASKLGGLTLAQVQASVGRKPARVLWVAPSGGDFTLLSAALASITDNDATHPYVIHIAPGTYTETAMVEMKTYVDVVGSGELVTTIECACGGQGQPWTDGSSSAIRIGGTDTVTEISDLTVRNLAGIADNAAGLSITAAGSPTVRVSHLTAESTGAFFAAIGLSIVATGSGHQISDVTARAVGTGNFSIGVVQMFTAGVTYQRVQFIASGGTTQHGAEISNSTATIRDSTVSGSTVSLFSSLSTVNVANTVITGPVLGATFHCIGAVNGSTFAALSGTCT